MKLIFNEIMPLINKIRTFEFEVAFSFLEEDEQLAITLNDLIQDRFKTFIYNQHQKELVGKDGSEFFRDIFEEKSRIVVILYREKWGTTRWTKVEEQAIKRRCFEENSDFTIFISLDKKKPKWLSDFQIWYDFDRFGIKPTAAIIEKRIREYGGVITEESMIDLAMRIKRNNEFAKKLMNYLESKDALKDAQDEIEILLGLCKSNFKKLAENDIGLIFDCGFGSNFFTAFSRNFGMCVSWKIRFSNSLRDSNLHIYFGTGDLFNRTPGMPLKIIKESTYTFYRNQSLSKGWIITGKPESFTTTSNVVDKWIKLFLEKDNLDKKEERKNFGLF